MFAIRSGKLSVFTVICSRTLYASFPFVTNWTGRRTEPGTMDASVAAVYGSADT